jgi:hypothetical protein
MNVHQANILEATTSKLPSSPLKLHTSLQTTNNMPMQMQQQCTRHSKTNTNNNTNNNNNNNNNNKQNNMQQTTHMASRRFSIFASLASSETSQAFEEVLLPHSNTCRAGVVVVV